MIYEQQRTLEPFPGSQMVAASEAAMTQDDQLRGQT